MICANCGVEGATFPALIVDGDEKKLHGRSPGDCVPFLKAEVERYRIQVMGLMEAVDVAEETANAALIASKGKCPGCMGELIATQCDGCQERALEEALGKKPPRRK